MFLSAFFIKIYVEACFYRYFYQNSCCWWRLSTFSFEFVITGGNIVNPLSIDPNERVTPSHHSGNNGLIDPMVDPTSGEMNNVVNQNGINGNMGIDGAELMASLAVTEIGVIPPPPMFSCSPSPPPPPPPPSSAIDHRSSQQSAHSTSSVVQPGHIITVSSLNPPNLTGLPGILKV